MLRQVCWQVDQMFNFGLLWRLGCELVHVVGVFTIQHDLKLVYQYFDGDIDYISVKKIEEQDKPGEIYFTVLDDEMAKSELANRYKVNQIL